jgi:hypothetical protein
VPIPGFGSSWQRVFEPASGEMFSSLVVAWSLGPYRTASGSYFFDAKASGDLQAETLITNGP